jgi:hypothetical protein
VAAALGAHDGKRRLRQTHHAEEVGFDLGAEVVEVDVLDRRHVGVAGVVDQHVESAESVDGGGDRSADVVVVGDVERDDGEVVGVPSRKVVQRRCGTDAGDHAVPGVQRGLGNGTPQSARGSGNEKYVCPIGHGGS